MLNFLPCDDKGRTHYGLRVARYWLLVTGHWSLVTGYWSLVAGLDFPLLVDTPKS
jgi:hypothetical protein